MLLRELKTTDCVPQVIWILDGCTFADRHIPKAASFRWHPRFCHWWTNDPVQATAMCQQVRVDASVKTPLRRLWQAASL